MANYDPLTSSRRPLRKSLPSFVHNSSRDPEKNDISDDSDSDSDYSSSAFSPSTSSRQTSGSCSSNKPMLGQKLPVGPRRSMRNRLPSRVTRYLCLGLISTLAILIMSLVRASITSSRRIELGDLGVRPLPPPEPWRAFQFLTRYYGGIRTLVPLADQIPEYPSLEEGPTFSNSPSTHPNREIPASTPFNAYHNRSSADSLANFVPVRQCFLDYQSGIVIPRLQHYQGRPNGFPDNIMGSYELLGLPEDTCFERYGRLGPYGYGYPQKYGGMGTGEHGDKEGFDSVWRDGTNFNQIDYRNANWADAQQKCFQVNKERFEPKAATLERPTTFSVYAKDLDTHPKMEMHLNSSSARPSKYLPRTAVVIRTWDEFQYHEEDILHLRAMISELSLGSGGEYDVHLLVQVKDEGKNPIWADAETYEKHLNESVPEEFRGIATMWSETQMLMLYQGIFDTFARGPELTAHGPYRGLQMAMQYFAHRHSEYDFFWHWEMDTRYTGHYYNLFSHVEAWSMRQPRKGLWERSSRFYIPSVHGSWEDFKQMVRVQTEMGTESPDKMWSSLKGAKAPPKGDKSIWGPERPQHAEDWFETENDPVPPTGYDKDKYQWGVGEQADLITFSPIFDPEGTTWLLATDITGYNTSNGLPPRRAAIVTSSRMSRRLLQTMHRETSFRKHHAFSEMWAPTTALHHGYKAVYVPHPMFVDREWPTSYLAGVMNSGRNGATGGARTSVFGDREHNLLGMTWYYNAGFAPNLWKRWLGLKVNNEGGEEFELTVDEGRDGKDVNSMKGGEGRMCLPPMLIHPVKGVELPVEGLVLEEEIPQSDPMA